MTVTVDIWLRGQDFATTRPIVGIERDPPSWTDDDVRMVLEGMLLEMHRLKHPDEADPTISLRGLSWIVNPYEEGGVVIAIEVPTGAAISGPFHIAQGALEAMIGRVLTHARAPQRPPTVH